MPGKRGTIAERLFAKIDRSVGPDACHPFTGGIRGGNGYGRICVGPGSRNRQAHVVAWELENGPIPPGLVAMHLCDVTYPVGSIEYRKCCNPRHIVIGTNAANSAHMARVGRAASGDRHVSRTRPERVPRGDRNGHRTHPERYPRGDSHHSRTKPECLARGERNGLATLTDEQAREIVASLQRGESGASIARRIGTTQYAVSHIRRGHTWRHISGLQSATQKSRLTPEQVREIRAAFAAGAKISDMARRYGVCRTSICNVKYCFTFKHV